MSLTTAEEQLVQELGFDRQVCELFKSHTGSTLQRLTGLDAEFEPYVADGLSAAVDRQDHSRLVNDLLPKLTTRGYRVFGSELPAMADAEQFAEIALLKTDDKFAMLRLRNSNGINHGVTTEKLIDTLRHWESRCEFRVCGASCDWVAIDFQSLPNDICTFAEEIYRLCPDSVEQGVGLMNERDDPELFAEARRMFPTLSGEMEKQLARQLEEFNKNTDIPPELKVMVMKLSTSTGMGIRLLAYELHRSKELFLWWD